MALVTRGLIATLMCGLLFTAGPARGAAPGDVTLASGDLVHSGLSNELFQIDDLWVRVAEGTEFHRWLSRAIDRKVAIVLTTSTSGLTDEAGTRILTGKLIHQTAPKPTSNTVDVSGQLPPGDLPMVHVVFLRDELTGTIGAVTLETAASATAAKLQGFDNALVSIIIRTE